MTEQQHQAILDSIGAVRTDVATMAVTIKERFDGVDKRFDGVDKRLDGVDKRLDGVEGRLGKVEGRLGKVEGRLGSLEETVVKNHDHIIVYIDRVFGELSGRITDLETARATPRARRRV
jgi:predicted nuclease with TOPRIM domain